MACLWSEEHDRLPLKQRMKILVANNKLDEFMSEYNAETLNSSDAAVDVASKVEDVIQPDSEEVKVETDYEALFDDLDHISLIERQLMLSRRGLRLNSPHQQADSLQLSSYVLNKKIRHSSEIVHVENLSVEKGFCGLGNQLTEIQHNLTSDSSKREIVVVLFSPGNEPTSGRAGKREKHKASCLKEKLSESRANIGQHNLSQKFDRSDPVIKVESSNNDGICANEIYDVNLPSNCMIPMKSEPVLLEDSEDILDHMLLRDRMKMTSPREVSRQDVSTTKCSRKFVSPELKSGRVAPDVAKQRRSTHTRKRRKTCTDSIETALEEDAPGLLQVLIEKGVTVDEIRLYGEMESDKALDDSSLEDSFSELEAVISKLFSQRTSLLKLDPLRSSKGEKVSYCLACLFSLVEQARYLRFREWPVEWGWCRDLQSFIFVFERHNRIVLERPEYGFATYFFELLCTLPTDWQIKRLVTAMKLTCCSRISLIENKELVVGEDLSEAEAKVLMGYGWVPNTGLGTMLNYRDRVIHDRQNEKDTSEWRSKIGRLLVDGYNGGCVLSSETFQISGGI